MFESLLHGNHLCPEAIRRLVEKGLSS